MNINPTDLNNFYCTVARELANDRKSNKDPISFFPELSPAETFNLNPTTKSEMEKVIKTIRNENSSEVDELALRIFRHLPDEALSQIV